MTVTLHEVTRDNFYAVGELDLLPEQRGLVASNLYSLAEWKFRPDACPRAVYSDGQLAGFLMYAQDEEAPGDIEIFRLMVDWRYQRRGIGREALRLALAEIRCLPGAERVLICYRPDNAVARRLYAGFGFVETGMDGQGEMVAVLATRNPLR
jgi:diamine N-acetyltransferase